MAGPVALQYLSSRECQCEPSLTFYIVLGATIFLAIVNVVGGLVFCVWRRARAQRNQAWGPNEKSRLSVADLTVPHPTLSRADVEAPIIPQSQQASEHVKVLVEVQEHTDARSVYGPPPRRRSGAALLAKVLGVKRRSQQSTKSSVPRSPASSTRSRRSPLDPPYPPPLPSPPGQPGPFEEPVWQTKVVHPKPRTVSLYGEKHHKTSESGNHLMPPQGFTSKNSASVLDRGNSVRTTNSTLPSSTKYGRNSVSALSTIEDSSVEGHHKPPPLPLTEDNRFSRGGLTSPGVESPSSIGHAPSAMFSGTNAPRALSYVWPRSEASDNTAVLSYARSESDDRTPNSASQASFPNRTSAGNPYRASTNRMSRVPAVSATQRSGLRGSILSSPNVQLPKLPASPTSPPPIPTSAHRLPISPVRFAPLSPAYAPTEHNVSSQPRATTLTARRLSELPPPKYTRLSTQSRRKSNSISTISSIDYVSGTTDSVAPVDTGARTSLASPTPPGLIPQFAQSQQPDQQADAGSGNQVSRYDPTTRKKHHIQRPSMGLTGPREPKSAGLR